MRNKFSVTITDVNGARHFELSHVIKKFILYFFVFVALLIGGGAYLINFLMDEVSVLEEKKEKIAQEQLALLEERASLQSEIQSKTEQYEDIRDKVEDIEELIGLKSSNDVQMDQRLDLLKVSSNERKLILDNLPSGFPSTARRITSGFGWRMHTIKKRKIFHHGLDFGGKIGTPVRATSEGIVEFAGFDRGGYGYLIKVVHNYGFKTSYAHLTKKLKVKQGDYVKKGQIIGYLGNSGRSTGPHLHYEVKFIKRTLDPINFVRWNAINFESIFKKENRVSWQSLVNAIVNQHKSHQQQWQSNQSNQHKAYRQRAVEDRAELKNQHNPQKRLSLLMEQKLKR